MTLRDGTGPVTRSSDERSLFQDAELAVRVAEYVRGSLSVGQSVVGDIETETRRAWFTVEAADGHSVRVTVDDTTGELA